MSAIEVEIGRHAAGAGVDPRKVVRPGKRLRNWHRTYNAATDHAGPPTPLKVFARRIISRSAALSASAPSVTVMAIALNIVDHSPAAALVGRWLASKGARP